MWHTLTTREKTLMLKTTCPSTVAGQYSSKGTTTSTKFAKFDTTVKDKSKKRRRFLQTLESDETHSAPNDEDDAPRDHSTRKRTYLEEDDVCNIFLARIFSGDKHADMRHLHIVLDWHPTCAHVRA